MVTLEAMRIHGGYGYTSEFPVERYYRDAAALLVGPRDQAGERRRLAARRSRRPVSYGRFYEEFTVGQEFTHWPGRTITEADCTWFALLTMNQHPLHSRRPLRRDPHPARAARGAGPAGLQRGDRHDGGRHLGAGHREPRGRTSSSTRSRPSSATRSTRRAACSRCGSRARATAASSPWRRRASTSEARPCAPIPAAVLVPRKNHATLGEGRLPY